MSKYKGRTKTVKQLMDYLADKPKRRHGKSGHRDMTSAVKE
jgi:hypothetical protein